jgi:FkbM family methyltransferase
MLDEIFSPGYGEDIDFSLRVRQRGYEWKCIDNKIYDGKQWVGSFPARHVGTATFKTIPEYGSVIVPRNQAILRERYNKPTGLKLHLACGFDYLEGYINVDLYPQQGARVDASFDVKKLPYEDNSVDEIRALHIIEHFDFYEGQEVLKEWFRALKPGGKLILETPDLLESCRAFAEGSIDDQVHLYGHLFAQPWIPGQVHKFLFTETQLKTQLGWAGFDRINRIAPMSNYLKSYPNERLFLAVEAYKFNFSRLERQDPVVYKEIFKDNDYKVEQSEIQNKIVIDIGANVGMFSLYAMSLSAHKVYAVEAQPNIYKTLLENTNGVGSIVPLNYAVYSESGKVVRLSNEKGLSKIQEMGDAATTITLEKLLDDNNIIGNDLVLKMDCEGAEFDILLNTDKKVLSRFKTVYIEIHGNTNQNPAYRNVSTIETLLSNLGLYKLSSSQYYEYIPVNGVTQSRPMQTFIQKWAR